MFCYFISNKNYYCVKFRKKVHTFFYTFYETKYLKHAKTKFLKRDRKYFGVNEITRNIIIIIFKFGECKKKFNLFYF